MGVPMKYLKIKCLVVDDEPSMRKTVSNMLSRMGFTSILTAENGRKALDIIKMTPIDLVIADVNMPEMTGAELFKTVRDDKNYDHIIFIFVTAEATRQIVARAAEDGGEGYIIKPFVLGTLEDKIARALEKKFNPSAIESCFKEFDIAMVKRDFQRAEEALGKAARMAPDAAKVVHSFGLLYLAKGDDKRAIEFFEEAISKNPMFVRSYNSLGEIYENIGDPATAIKYYEKAHEISPANTDRLLALSKLFCKTGETDRAEKILKDAVSDMREDVAASGQLMGEIYLAKNDNEKALEMLKRAYDQNPSAVSIMESLAEAYRRVGQPEEALKLYKECLKIVPESASTFYCIGKTYLEMSDKKNAIAAIKKAWALNPHSREITADLKALAEKNRLNL
ncbi:MAG: tetratricopeptide repeat protein [Nitrospirae bacterium]|nr:tetratricopeptide repeat protein [Nitrospirota bacterium]